MRWPAVVRTVVEDRTRVRVTIRGRVQGVYFRESTRQLAERLHVAGWVRNVPGGLVEAVFEGPPAAVAQAVAWCRNGPPGARVDAVETKPQDPIGEMAFRVRPTQFGF